MINRRHVGPECAKASHSGGSGRVQVDQIGVLAVELCFAVKCLVPNSLNV